MRKKTTHSSSAIPQLYKDFQIYRSLKSLQKTSNPYSVSRMSTTKKSRPSSVFLPAPLQVPLPKAGSPKRMKKRPMPKGISEEKSKEIQEMIENQIRGDVKHYSEIGESALSGFKEKVSLYNSFFTRYLFDNHKDISRADLVVQPFSLFTGIGNEPPPYNDDDASPQEKLRRQNKRGSIFGGTKKESPKLSPTSPMNRPKAYTFVKGKFTQTPMNFGRIRVESKKELVCDIRNTNNEKKDYKNSWEYCYYVGDAELQEIKKGLDGAIKNLNVLGEEKDMEKRIFIQMVKKNQVEHVRTMLDGRRNLEKNWEKSRRLINTIDVYVNFFFFFYFYKNIQKKFFFFFKNNIL